MRVRGVTFSTSLRAIVLPDRRGAVTTVEEAMPMLGGTKVDDTVMVVVEALRANRCEVTSKDHNRLQVLGPNGEGPVYLNSRAHSKRDVDNMRTTLRKHGLDVISEINERVGPALDSPPPDSVKAELKQSDGFQVSNIEHYVNLLPNAVIDAMTNLIHVTTAEFSTRGDAGEWQKLAEEADNERQAALRRAAKAEETSAALATERKQLIKERDELRAQVQQMNAAAAAFRAAFGVSA